MFNQQSLCVLYQRQIRWLKRDVELMTNIKSVENYRYWVFINYRRRRTF